MNRVLSLDGELKKKLLYFLYKDEIYNVNLINLVHNNMIKELYLFEKNNEISAVLHINYDGNSYFTNFDYDDEEGFKEICNQLKKLSYHKILLAGKTEVISKILMDYNKSISSFDVFYKFEGSVNETKNSLRVRMAEENEIDIATLKKFYIEFFEAETEEDKKEISEENLIRDDIRDGVYFIESEGNPIGMARICARTDNYGEITGVYIVPEFRGNNYGMVIVSHLVKELIKEGRCAVLQADSTNIPAVRLYERVGFKKIGDYSFEFLT